jgi:hypothetical protein
MQGTLCAQLRKVWNYTLFPQRIEGGICDTSPSTAVGYVAIQSAKDRWDVKARYYIHSCNGRVITMDMMVDRIWGGRDIARDYMMEHYSTITEDEARILSRRINENRQKAAALRI